MIYVLDTNILIGILRENQKIVLKYKALDKNKSEIGITSYTLAELYEGIKRLESKQKKEGQLKILENLINKFEKHEKIYSLTRNEAMKYAELKILLETVGKPIPIIDLLIGTIVIVNNYNLITSDKNHFQILKDIYPSFNVDFWT